MRGYYTHIKSQKVYAVLGLADHRLGEYRLVVYLRNGRMFCKALSDFEQKFVKNLTNIEGERCDV